jgi:ParB-like chromosome segregation protein Spo0J
MEIKLVKLSEIKSNPNNPRIIKDDKFRKLVKSIQEFPKMLEIRPVVVNADMIVLGGNMRLKACKEAGLKEVPVIFADDLTDDEQKQFIIKDNVGFGEWDWDMIANEWEPELLEDWGLEIPSWSKIDVQNPKDPSEYDFENFDNSGFTTIKVVLIDEQAKELIDRIDLMKGDKNLSEFVYEYFCN